MLYNRLPLVCSFAPIECMAGGSAAERFRYAIQVVEPGLCRRRHCTILVDCRIYVAYQLMEGLIKKEKNLASTDSSPRELLSELF